MSVGLILKSHAQARPSECHSIFLLSADSDVDLSATSPVPCLPACLPACLRAAISQPQLNVFRVAVVMVSLLSNRNKPSDKFVSMSSHGSV